MVIVAQLEHSHTALRRKPAAAKHRQAILPVNANRGPRQQNSPAEPFRICVTAENEKDGNKNRRDNCNSSNERGVVFLLYRRNDKRE